MCTMQYELAQNNLGARHWYTPLIESHTLSLHPSILNRHTLKRTTYICAWRILCDESKLCYTCGRKGIGHFTVLVLNCIIVWNFECPPIFGHIANVSRIHRTYTKHISTNTRLTGLHGQTQTEWIQTRVDEIQDYTTMYPHVCLFLKWHTNASHVGIMLRNAWILLMQLSCWHVTHYLHLMDEHARLDTLISYLLSIHCSTLCVVSTRKWWTTKNHSLCSHLLK